MMIEAETKEISDKLKDFGSLLDKINSLDDKKKQLWKEIYGNALTDRSNAYMMFSQLVTIVGNSSSEHAIHGRSLSSYIERMSRANDQIIRLAELVSEAEEKSESIDAESLFKQMSTK